MWKMPPPPDDVLVIGGHPVYVGICCREWDMAFYMPAGSCGLCGKKPKFDRWATK